MKCGRFFFVKIENVVHRKEILCAGVLHERRKSSVQGRSFFCREEVFVYGGNVVYREEAFCAHRQLCKQEGSGVFKTFCIQEGSVVCSEEVLFA